MKLIRHEQGSKEWLAWRRDGIGGSDMGVLMGVNIYKNKSYRKLLEQKIGTGRDDPPNFAMRKGSRYESMIRAAVEERYDLLLPACCVQADPPYEFMRSSLDGLSFTGRTIFEGKYSKEEHHDQALAGVVPEHHVPQVQYNLLVSGADLCLFASYSDNEIYKGDPELEFAVVEVFPDAEYQVQLIEAAEAFWREVMQGRKAKVSA